MQINFQIKYKRRKHFMIADEAGTPLVLIDTDNIADAVGTTNTAPISIDGETFPPGSSRVDKIRLTENGPEVEINVAVTVKEQQPI